MKIDVYFHDDPREGQPALVWIGLSIGLSISIVRDHVWLERRMTWRHELQSCDEVERYGHSDESLGDKIFCA
jgi:hypothetical protein